MDGLILLELFALCAFVAFLIRHYSAEDVPAYITLTCYVSWVLSFSVLVIVPVDVRETLSHGGEDEAPKNDSELVPIWTFYYWSMQILGWIVLPIMQSYEMAGEFDFKGKMRRAIMENLVFYLVAVVLLAVILLYNMLYGSFSLSELFTYLGALSNFILLLMVVCLLGHGLVAIPKYCLETSSLDSQITRYRWQAIQAYEQQQESKRHLEDAVRTLHFLFRQPCNAHYSNYFTKMIAQIPADISYQADEEKIQSQPPAQYLVHAGSKAPTKDVAALDMSKIIRLNWDLKQACLNLRRAQITFQVRADRVFLVEDIVDNKFSIDQKIRSPFWVQNKGECGTWPENFWWVWYTKARSPTIVALAVCSLCLSLVYFFSEVFSSLGLVDKSLLRVFQLFTRSHVIDEIVLQIPLLYVMLCAYYSLFNLKLFSYLNLYPYKQTDGVALLFGALNFTRVSPAIAYHFLQLIGLKNTSFHRIVGDMDIVPIFGEANTVLFPIILILLIIMNALDLYKKCMTALELRQFQFKDEVDAERVADG